MQRVARMKAWEPNQLWIDLRLVQCTAGGMSRDVRAKLDTGFGGGLVLPARLRSANPLDLTSTGEFDHFRHLGRRTHTSVERFSLSFEVLTDWGQPVEVSSSHVNFITTPYAIIGTYLMLELDALLSVDGVNTTFSLSTCQFTNPSLAQDRARHRWEELVTISHRLHPL